MKSLRYIFILYSLLIAAVSCSDGAYYNSDDARADLLAAEAQYQAGTPMGCDTAALRRASNFFVQHDMDRELVQLLLLKARYYHDNNLNDECRSQLLYAASVAEGNGSESLKAQVYRSMHEIIPADTCLLRQALQRQQQYLANRSQRDSGHQLQNILHWTMLLLVFIAAYISYQSLRIRMQNAKITALRLELQNRDVTEHEGISHLLTDAAVLRFRTAFAERYTVTMADWAALHQAFTRHYPKFEQRLKQLHPLSEIEWQVCMLLRLDFPPTDIATFTLRSQATISTIRSRLYSKFFMTKGSPSDWDSFIHKL